MAWELIPIGSCDIYESNQMLERKGLRRVIGQCTHYRVDRNGALTGLQMKDGPEIGHKRKQEDVGPPETRSLDGKRWQR